MLWLGFKSLPREEESALKQTYAKKKKMPGSVLYEKQSGFLQARPICPLCGEPRTRKCGEQYYSWVFFVFSLASGYTLWGRVEGKCVRIYGTFQSGFTWLLS